MKSEIKRGQNLDYNMFEIKLKNNKTFNCDNDTSILEAAKNANVFLEHSCMKARCNSCKVKVLKGETINIQEENILTEKEIKELYILSCNARPLSNISLDIEDLGKVILYNSKTFPAKIKLIEKTTNNIIKIVLRLPPSTSFNFAAGQYVNIIKGNIKRSYSIASNVQVNNTLEFFIKKYENGLMSNYWFNEAKENDLLRLEGPLGTFFYRENILENIVFLATGTGISPVKAVLEQFRKSPNLCEGKKVWLFWGGRYMEDFFWSPEFKEFNFKFIPVLSRENNKWSGETGYVQDVVLKQKMNVQESQVYACGSIDMIKSAKQLFLDNSMPENRFFSDAFVNSN